MLVVIIGCGQMGSQLANMLSKRGTSVIVIDIEESSFNNLSSDFSGFQITADGTQIEVLKQAKVSQADLLLVLTNNDNINLMVAQVGKHFLKVPSTIARVSAPERVPIFTKLGIDSICPTSQSVASLLETIDKME